MSHNGLFFVIATLYNIFMTLFLAVATIYFAIAI